MKISTYLLLSFFFAFVGMLFFCLKNEFIVIQYPTTTPQQTTNSYQTNKKGTVNFIFWKNSQWKTESHDLLLTNSKQQCLHHLIDALLTFLYEENYIEKKVSVQTVLLAASDQTAYISFDSNPLSKESSTLEKWLFIEGILKTIRENNIPLQYIQFLVHHQLMQDAHIDFSKPWPIDGFLS